MTLKNNLEEKENKKKLNKKKKKNIPYMIPCEPDKEFDIYDKGSEFDYIGEDY
jgi:hypothetical protein